MSQKDWVLGDGLDGYGIYDGKDLLLAYFGFGEG